MQVGIFKPVCIFRKGYFLGSRVASVESTAGGHLMNPYQISDTTVTDVLRP
jgi:hypothetical protein